MAKAIKGITVEIGAETTGLTKALKKIDSQSSKLQKELKEVEKLLKLDPTNTELLSQKQQLLAKSLENVQSKLSTLRSAQAQVDKAFSNNADWEKAYTPLQKQLETTRDKLDKLKSKQTEMENKLNSGKISTEKYESYRKELENVEKEYQNLQKSKRDLEKEFQSRGGHLDEEAYRNYQRELIATEQELQRLQKAQEDTNSASSSFADGLSVISSACNDISSAMQPVTDVIVKLGEEIWGLSTEFENSMAKLSIIADMDIDSDNYIKMKDGILELSDSCGVASSELAQLTYDAISSGVEVEKAVDFVGDSAVKLAKVGSTDTSKSLDILTTILNAYKIEAEDATKVSDMLLTTQKEGKITIDELSSSMGKVIPTANSLGVEVDQLCAGYIELTKNGIKSFNATTYMNSMLNELGKTGSKVDDALKRITGTVQAVSDDQYKILEEQYEMSEKSLDKSLESREKAVEKSYEQQSKDLEKAIERDIKAKEDELQKSLDMIDEEYTEKLKLNDEERYNAIKQIEDQIDGINAQTDLEEQAIEDRENARKRASYEEKIATAETIEERQQAEQDLYEFEENLALKQRKKERQEQIDALKEQQDSIKEYYDNKAEEIENEKKSAIETQEEINNEILKQFEETQNLKLDKLDEQKERELARVQEVNEEEKKLWEEAWKDILDTAKVGSADGKGFAELIEDGYTLADVMVLLQQYADKTETSFNDLWSNTNARKSANVLLENAEEYSEELAIVQNSSGATEEALTRLDTTTVQINKSLNQVKNSGIVLGSTLLDMIAPALDSLAGIVQKLTSGFNGLSTSTQAVIITLLTVVALIAPVAKIVGGISGAIQTVIAILPTLLNFVSLICGVVKGLFMFLGDHPIVALIGLVIANLVILYKTCEPFREFVDGIVFKVKDFFSSLPEKFTEFGLKFGNFIQSLKNYFNDFGENLKLGWKLIGDFFSDLWDGICESAKTPLNAIIGFINKIIGGINSLIDGINTVNIGDFQFNIPNINEIPMLATGGVLSSGSAIVGERGPELLSMIGNHAVVQPLTGSQAIDTATNSTSISQKNLSQFTGTIEVPVYLYHNSTEFARAVITASQLNDCVTGGR